MVGWLSESVLAVGTTPEVVLTMTVPTPSGLNLKRTELPEEDLHHHHKQHMLVRSKEGHLHQTRMR